MPLLARRRRAAKKGGGVCAQNACARGKNAFEGAQEEHSGRKQNKKWDLDVAKKSKWERFLNYTLYRTTTSDPPPFSDFQVNLRLMKRGGGFL